MNKSQLVEFVAKKTNLSKRVTTDAVELFLDQIKSQLASGKKVTLTGFGTFSISKRSARNGVNPQTNKPIHIPAQKVPRFKASKELREKI
jgi:DNA-binding protein HU-beta